MEAKNEEVVAHLLSDVVEFARGRLPEATFRIVEPFLRHYYDFVDADDLQSRSIADLYGAAMAHWQTAQKFVPGSERLRVYNPILEQHGWHSDHTVIEIVNDDMPFLVDSVSMAVNRLGPRCIRRCTRYSASGAVATAASSASTRAARRPATASRSSRRSSISKSTAAAMPRCSTRCATTSRTCSATCARRWKTGRRSSRSRARRSRK